MFKQQNRAIAMVAPFPSLYGEAHVVKLATLAGIALDTTPSRCIDASLWRAKPLY
jgi:hypothetical protein